jgi:hypothetical protein
MNAGPATLADFPFNSLRALAADAAAALGCIMLLTEPSLATRNRRKRDPTPRRR